jgi:pimeloyl-ACP methyl ester carboxylesterase
MLRRLYWLLPDLKSAQAAMDDLLLGGIDWRHMHFVARDGVDTSGLHVANVLQTSDFVRSAERGLIIGASVGGLLGALVAVLYPDAGDDPQWGMAVMVAISGAFFGPWAASMIGVSTPSERLKRFAPQIEQGRILLMIDVPLWRVEQIEARLRALHPDAHSAGSEPDIPAFP